MKIFGIDFTSSPSARKTSAKNAKWMTLARCTLEGNQLTVDEFELLNGDTTGDFSILASILSSESKWIAGIDVPIGLPIQCIEYFGLLRPEDKVQTWETYIRKCSEVRDRKSFKKMIESWRHPIKKNARNEFERVRKYRLVDKLALAQSPMNCIRPPVGQMFYEAAKLLIASPAKIAPVRLNNDERVIVEAYPRLVADRFIASGNYKEADGLEHIRQLIIDQLRLTDGNSIMRQWYGFSVQVSNDIANSCVTDRDGDKLDSILCAVQAAWAFHQADYGTPVFQSTVMRNIVSLEGWIADPFMNKWSKATVIEMEALA